MTYFFNRRRRTWVLFAIVLIGLTFGGLLIYNSKFRNNFSSPQQFSVKWKQTAESDRHKLLPWLVGQKPARHTVYPLQQTPLAGLSRPQVIALLGPDPYPLENIIFYSIGSIEIDIGRWIIPIAKADVLMITFDEQDLVIKVETTS